MLNLHQLTDSKVQLNKINANNCKSNNLGGHNQSDTGGDREAMVDLFSYFLKFNDYNPFLTFKKSCEMRLDRYLLRVLESWNTVS